MLRTGGEHERQFGHWRKAMGGAVEEHLTDFFSGGCAARFACHEYRHGLLDKNGGKPLDLRAFTAAIQAFKGDQIAAIRVGRHGKIIA